MRPSCAGPGGFSCGKLCLVLLFVTMRVSLVTALQLPFVLAESTVDVSGGKTCVVQPGLDGSDSAPAIVQAFRDCGHNDAAARGKVVFLNQTYTVKTVMNTTGLSNVDIDHQGTLLWDTNISYWLNASLPVGYQNQSSAWLFGGEGVSWDGHGYGTLDGNGTSGDAVWENLRDAFAKRFCTGQVWYDFINGTNNYPGRPHSITITGTQDSVFQRLRFVQSQMW